MICALILLASLFSQNRGIGISHFSYFHSLLARFSKWNFIDHPNVFIEISSMEVLFIFVKQPTYANFVFVRCFVLVYFSFDNMIVFK